MPCMAFINVNVAFIGDYNYSQCKSTPHGEHKYIMPSILIIGSGLLYPICMR